VGSACFHTCAVIGAKNGIAVKAREKGRHCGKKENKYSLRTIWRFGKLVIRDYGRATVLMSLSTGQVQLRDLDERFWIFEPRSIAHPPHIKYVCT
jgi:hypothetical protein